ncbi:MAG: hypothetical protein JRI31_04095, partial [Deltaproteobacteria bacterium]|nr:hypothetical protein [Deltaproteobacteria bacterium]
RHIHNGLAAFKDLQHNIPLAIGGPSLHPNWLNRLPFHHSSPFHKLNLLLIAGPVHLGVTIETPWYNSGGLHWLWVMVNPVIAFLWFMGKRSKEAFKQLIGQWEGILVSDG